MFRTPILHPQSTSQVDLRTVSRVSLTVNMKMRTIEYMRGFFGLCFFIRSLTLEELGVIPVSPCLRKFFAVFHVVGMVAYNKCCNPLKENAKHSKVLRQVSTKIKIYFPTLNKDAKICNTCRLKIEKEYLGFDEYIEIVRNMKQKIDDEDISASEKTLILSFLPKTWSARRIAEFSGVSRWTAGKIKKNETAPKIENQKRLSSDVVKQVKSFYESDENSRIMPGMKDTKCVKNDNGEKLYLQKRLILYNLRELYPKFKAEFPDLKIGISKFAEFRPPNCVFAGSSGTHVVCVCVYHQNMKLMLEGLNISRLTSDAINDYKDCVALLVCTDPTPQCHLSQCEKCPGAKPLMDRICHLLEENNIDKIQFKSWLTTDRASLQTRVVQSEDFVQELGDALMKLKPHSFLAKEQGTFFKKLKMNLKTGEFLVVLDFAENYQFVVQDAAQSFHYNNDQCTLVTVVIYFCDEQTSTIQHRSMTILSDCLIHDTTAVYCCQEIITKFIKENFPFAKEVLYFSDGAAQHFKNKFNFVNLLHHDEDFALKAEWHFHVTAHGKNACDGIGAIIKSNARRESLHRISSDHILTPFALYDWAKNRFQNIEISFLSKDHYEITKKKLEQRFEAARRIPGTKSYHCFKVSNGTKQLDLRLYSSAENFDVFPKSTNKENHRCKKRKLTLEARDP